ncbi:MAG TPA: hypothetical protein VGE94_01460, partial [Chloroflexota bacterium]
MPMLVSALVLEWLRGERWGRAVRVLVPLAAMVVEGWPALLGALLIQEGGLWLTGRLVEPCQRAFGRGLFLAAFGLRVAIALPTHYVAKLSDGNGALFQDDYTNDLVGEWLVRIARGDGISIFPGHQHLLDGFYPYLLMGLYSVFGYSPLLPKLLNTGLAALSAVLIFEIARRTFRLRSAVLAAIGAALLPTMIVWSIVTLKESLVLCVSLLGLWAVQSLSVTARRDERFMSLVVVLVGVLALLLDLRLSAAGILLCLAIATYFVKSRHRLRPWQVAIAVVGLVAIAGGGLWTVRARTTNRPITAVVEDAVLTIRHRRAQEAASASSRIRTEADVFSATGSEIPASEAASDAAPFSISGDVLEPLGYALLAPAPWQARSTPELGAAAEMPVWYVLLGASLLAWRSAPRQPFFVVCLAAYGVANWLVLA